MADIETNKSIILENLLSLRKKMLSTEINEEMIKISKLFAANGIKKAGPIVTTTFAVLENNVLDMEILVPMDKIFELPNEYKFKPKFKLTNAIYARHCGNPAFLQEVCNEMVEFISRNGLQQIKDRIIPSDAGKSLCLQIGGKWHQLNGPHAFFL